MNSADYLSVLNPEQLEAVKHFGSPLLILAGAGSGKTRVITTKIAYLIGECGVNPSSILAVTFTKKAALEMQQRAESLEPYAAKSYIRTFHSFGAWFLRLNAVEAGVSPNFTVYDDDDMVTLVSKAMPDISRQQATHIAHKISLAKDYCLEPDDPDLAEIEPDPEFPEAYRKYQERLRFTGNVDFGDLIMLPVLLLRTNESLRSFIHKKFRVIMVDEYQDSNIAQFALLEQLSGEGTYVCVVGDDDQSIYKFRGAEVRNILDFQEHFPGTTVIKLERNYRSFAPILAVADSVVSNNTDRLGKTLIAERGDGQKPTLVFLPNQDEEVKFCASQIIEAKKKGVPYSDWAILYRTNAQSMGFETEFLHRKIPYTVVGSLKFYEREEIKDVLAYLALVANPLDEIAFRRIVNKPPRGIGNVSQDKIVDLYRKNANKKYTLLDACLEAVSFMSKKAKESLNNFVEMFQGFVEALPAEQIDGETESSDVAVSESIENTGSEQVENEATENTASEPIENTASDKVCETAEKLSVLIEKIIEKSGLEVYHAAQDEIAGTQRVANLQELVNSAVLYPKNVKGLLDFLDHIELDRTLELADDNDDEDCVTLITLHNTKGLEFSRVIITGMEFGIFPRRDKIDEEKEEERRLFYVGITRAKDLLYMTSCAMRRIYGRTDFMEVSPFLYEIDKDQIDVVGHVPPSFKRALVAGNKSSGNAAGSNAGGVSSEHAEIAQRWAKGVRVYHDEYGYGAIIRTDDTDVEYVISVQFETGEVKRFMPKYQANKLMISKDF